MILRPEPRDQQPSIELHIEELLLHGLPLTRSQGPEVKAAIESELARVLTERGLSNSAASTTPQLSADIQLSGCQKTAHLGQQISRAILAGLTSVPASPRPTHSIQGATR